MEEAIQSLDTNRENPENGVICLNDEERTRPTGSRQKRRHGVSANEPSATSQVPPSRKRHHRHHKKKRHGQKAEKSPKAGSSKPASNVSKIVNEGKKNASHGDEHGERLHPRTRQNHRRPPLNKGPHGSHEKEKHQRHQKHEKKRTRTKAEKSTKEDGSSPTSNPKEMATNEQKKCVCGANDECGKKACPAVPRRTHRPRSLSTKGATTAVSQVSLSRNYHKTGTSPKEDISSPASNPKDMVTKAVLRRTHHPQSLPTNEATTATSHQPLSKKTTCGVDDPSPVASSPSAKETTEGAPHVPSSRNHVNFPDSCIGSVGTEVPAVEEQADMSKSALLPHSSDRVSEQRTRPTVANTTTERSMIFVPRAQDWCKGTKISDDKGNELFTVLCSEENGSTNTGSPRYQAFVADQDGTDVLAGVTMSRKGGLSSKYSVYTCFPAFDGQKPAKFLECTGISDAYMYQYATCVVKPFICSVKRVVGDTQKELALVSRAIQFGMFTSRRLVKFYQTGLREPVISRDQNMQTLSVVAGESLLLSVCLSYIIDRYSKPFGSKKERLARASDKRNVHGPIQCHLRKAIEGMRIEENARGQACSAENAEVVDKRILSPADPARERTTFPLPRAQDWHKGMRIADVNNQVIFSVFSNENFGTHLEPDFRVFIADEEGEHMLAVVSPEWPCWRIYACFPSYEGQKAAIRLSRKDKNDEDMYSYGKLYGGDFERCTGEHRKKDGVFSKVEVTRHQSFKSPRLIKLYKTGQSNPVFTRDQREESLTVAPGENLLVALCLSYAMDRETKKTGSTEERDARGPGASSAGQEVGSALGEQYGFLGEVVGTFSGMAIDSAIDNAREAKVREVTISKLE